jgi:hypothetical protein
MYSLRRIALAACVVLAFAASARADATLFLGANTTPSNRPVSGASLGAGFLVVAFEFEYSSTSVDIDDAAPSLKTYMGNGLLQTPFPIFGFQPYVTAGVGLYRERLGTHTDTGFAPNSGGGVKISLAGPLRLRVDYRVFRLGGGALHSPAHRLYAGLNLKF